MPNWAQLILFFYGELINTIVKGVYFKPVYLTKHATPSLGIELSILKDVRGIHNAETSGHTPPVINLMLPP